MKTLSEQLTAKLQLRSLALHATSIWDSISWVTKGREKPLGERLVGSTSILFNQKQVFSHPKHSERAMCHPYRHDSSPHKLQCFPWQ